MKTKWTINYDNAIGPRDVGFWEWWEILYEGQRVLKADTEEDAKNLADMLNRLEADRDFSVDRYVS